MHQVLKEANVLGKEEQVERRTSHSGFGMGVQHGDVYDLPRGSGDSVERDHNGENRETGISGSG